MKTQEEFQNYWSSLNEQLFVPPARIKRTDMPTDILYRGLPDSQYELTTALQRIPIRRQRNVTSVPITSTDSGEYKQEICYRERRLIDSFRKYGRSLLPFGTSDWEVMVVGQHYQLPTRLMDWTLSPLVALFFATESMARRSDDKEPDGVVWCVSHSATYNVMDSTLRKRLEDAKKGSADLDFMNQYPSIEAFDSEAYAPSLVWFEPHSVDQRIINQFAFFSMMQRADSRIDSWLEARQEVYWKLVVPGEMKALLRQRLYLYNISDRTLFPGLEGIARWQKAYYSD